MAQVKKLQTGGTADVSSSYTFKVKGKEYKKDEQFLLDMFNPMFEDMKANNDIGEKSREEYYGTFKQYLSQAKEGVYDVDASNGQYVGGNYEGSVDANLGRNEDGKTAMKTGLGKIFGKNQTNSEQRMAHINTYANDRLIKQFDTDEAEAKKKADADAAKLKADALKNTNSLLDKFGTYKDPYTAIYGLDGQNKKFATNQYWKHSDKNGRATGLNTGIKGLASYVFDPQFDNVENQKAFSEKYAGRDVLKIRERLTKAGYANGVAPKDLSVEDISSVLDDVDLRADWDGVIRQPEEAPIPLTPEQLAAKAAADKLAADTAAKNAEAAKQGITLDLDGNPLAGKGLDGRWYTNGKLTNDVRLTDKNDPNAYDDLKDGDGILWEGKLIEYDEFSKIALENPDNPSVIEMSKKLTELATYKTGILPNGSLGEVNKQNVTDKFAFHDKVQNGEDVSKIRASDESHAFSEIAGRKHESLVKYIVPGRDRFGTIVGKVKFRFHTSKGAVLDGRVIVVGDKYHFVQDGTKKRYNLGVYNPEAKPDPSRKAYYKAPLEGVAENEPSRDMYGMTSAPAKKNKEGGIITYQRGGTANTNQDFNFKSADIGTQVIGGQWSDLSTVDKVQLGAVGADLAGLIASYIPHPAATLGAGIAGVGGTIANGYTDWKRDGNFSGGDAAALGGGLLLDAATVIPGFGLIAKTSKTANTIRKAAKVLTVGFGAMGAVAAGSSLTKLLNDQKMEIDDWKNIAAGITGLVGGKRALDGDFATKRIKTNTISVGGKEITINAAQASAIRNAPIADQKRIAQEQITGMKDGDGNLIDINKLDLEETGNLSRLNKWSGGKFGKANEDIVPIVTSTTNGRQLIDFNKANWFQKSAIRNTVAQNPNISGANKYTIGGQRANTIENPTSNWVANSYKVKYDPAKPPVDQTGQMSNIVPGPNSPINGKPLLALPASSGKRVIGTEVNDRAIPMRAGARTDKTNPEAIVKVRDEAATKKQAIIDKFREGKAKREKESAKSVVDNDRKVLAERKQAKVDKEAQDKRDSVTKAKKENSNTARAKYEAGVHAKKQAKEFEAAKLVELQRRKKHLKEVNAYKQEKELGKRVGGQVAVEKQKKQFNSNLRDERKSELTKQAEDKGKRMKAGRSVKKRQGGGMLDFNEMVRSIMQSTGKQGDSTKAPFMTAQTTQQPFNFNNILNLPKTLMMGQIPSADVPKADIFDFADIQNIYKPKSVSTQSPFLPGQHPKGYVANPNSIGGTSTDSTDNNMSDRVKGEKSDKPSILSKLDGNTLSELARAMHTRRLNSQIDTKVERPMISAPIETPISVRGNMFAKTAMDTQANNVIQKSNIATSDQGLHTAAALQGNANAAQLRGQGDAMNIDALERSKGMAMESSAKNSLLRTEVANKNVQTLSAATQAERAAKNEKFARMNQPIMDFWKDQNYKKQYEAQQNKGIDTQIAMNSKEGEFNTAIKPLSTKMDANQLLLTQLERKSYQVALSPAEVAEVDRLTKENNLINEQVMELQGRAKNVMLNTRKDLGYLTPQGTYTPSMKEGGQVKLMVEETKQEGNLNREIVKQHSKMLSDNADEDTQKHIQNMRQIQELIKLALS